MKAYYQDSAVQIFHGDCREIVPTLGKFDLLLTDPPYGIGNDCDYSRFPKGGNSFDKIHGDDEEFDPTPFLSNKNKKIILWGANNYCQKLPKNCGWLVWQKQLKPSRFMSDCELAWFSGSRMIRCFNYERNIGEFPSDAVRARLHPTQKPVALMTWCIQLAGDVQTILDPFMGSGTTLRAAKDLGRKAVGIEIEERYAEIAAKRMQQEVLNFDCTINKKSLYCENETETERQLNLPDLQ